MQTNLRLKSKNASNKPQRRHCCDKQSEEAARVESDCVKGELSNQSQPTLRVKVLGFGREMKRSNDERRGRRTVRELAIYGKQEDSVLAASLI